MNLTKMQKMIKIILITLAIFIAAPAYANAPAENRQELMELYKRHAKWCTLYRVKIDDVSYIVNTCGGIIIEPKSIYDQ